MSRRYKQLFMLLVVTGCAPATPPTIPKPETGGKPAAVTPSPSGKNSWIILPTDQEHDYSSMTNTSLELISNRGAAQDTVTSRVEFTLSVARAADSNRFFGSITVISTNAGARIGSTGPNFRLPFAFSGHLTNSNLVFDASSLENAGMLTDCSSNPVLSAIPSIERAFILAPLQLHRGTIWRDSISVATCGGPIPITLFSIRTYQVLGEGSSGSAGTILIDRQDTIRFAGEGADGQHWTKIQGDGAGLARLQLDAETGALLKTDGQHRTVVSVTSSGRTRKFTQTIHENVSMIR